MIKCRAEYEVVLSTSIEIDFGQLPAPITIKRGEFQVVLEAVKYTEGELLADGNWIPGTLDRININLTSERLDDWVVKCKEQTLMEYEEAMLGIADQFITWSQILTRQTWLSGRLPVKSYTVRFMSETGKSLAQYKKRFWGGIVFHPDYFYCELSTIDWSSLAKQMQTESSWTIYLLSDAASLCGRGMFNQALLAAFSALEHSCKVILSRRHRKFLESRAEYLLDEMQRTHPGISVDWNRMHELRKRRNDLVHGKKMNIRSLLARPGDARKEDIEYIIETVWTTLVPLE